MPNHIPSLSRHFSFTKLTDYHIDKQKELLANAQVIYGKEFSPAHLEVVACAYPEIILLDSFYLADIDLNVIVATCPNEQVSQLVTKAREQQLEVATLALIPDPRIPGVFFMDMDSTAIQIECIDEIAKLAGVGEQVAAITEQAMQGNLDFSQSLGQRVATLTGLPVAKLEQIKLPYTPGLRELIAYLKEHAWNTGILSGGFTYFAQQLQQDLGLDEIQANTLEIDAKTNTLTGKVIGDLVDAQYKATALRAGVKRFAQRHNLAPEAVASIAVGDGANDLPMLAQASLGIAFHAKPKVIEKAKVMINQHSLTGIIAMLEAKKRFSN